MKEISRGVGRPRKKPVSIWQDSTCHKIRVKSPSEFIPGYSQPELFAFHLEGRKYLVVSENDLISMLSAVRAWSYDD